MTKLTLKELEYIYNNNDDIYYYEDFQNIYSSIFKYKKDGKWTLIQITDLEEGGKVLIQNVDDVHWYEKNTFKYIKDGKETLIQNDEILIQDVDWVEWHVKDGFIYGKSGEWAFTLKKEAQNNLNFFKNKVKND